MKRYLLVAAGGAAAALASTPANAALCIGVAVNGAAPTNVACDTATPGSVNYNTTTGGYFFNVSGTGSPVINMPQLLTQSVNIQQQSGANALIEVFITQTDLTSIDASLLSTFTSNTVLGLSAEITSYYDLANRLFTGTQLQSASFGGGGLFSGADYLNISSPWSETVRYRLDFSGGAGSNFNGTANLAAVPEPATWAMILLGFGAIGVTMRRQRRKDRNVVLAQIA